MPQAQTAVFLLSDFRFRLLNTTVPKCQRIFHTLRIFNTPAEKSLVRHYPYFLSEDGRWKIENRPTQTSTERASQAAQVLGTIAIF
jgi:hypothetical protein